MVVACRNTDKHVRIPDGTTSIAAGAFAGCDIMTDLIIPSTIETIGAGAFNGCTGLEEIRCFSKKVPEIMTTRAMFGGMDLTNTVLYVYEEVLSDYEEAWGEYFAAILPLESTDIMRVITSSDTSSLYYDLQGRRSAKPTIGVNIVKGQKVLVH